MRISDWSSDVCSSELRSPGAAQRNREDDQKAKGCKRRTPDRLKLDLEETPHRLQIEIGRASCRERGCQYVYISVVAVLLKKKDTKTTHQGEGWSDNRIGTRTRKARVRRGVLGV